MTSRQRKGQEDPLIGEDEDVLKAEVLQESLENLRSLVKDGPRKQSLPWYQSGGGRIYSAVP